MKTKLSLLGSLITLFLASYSARAIVVFQDNFPYANGPIDLVSGGNLVTAGGGVWVSGPGSFYGTTADVICNGANELEITGTGTSDLPRTYFTNGVAGLSMPGAPLFTNTVFFFPSNAPIPGLYASFTLDVDPSDVLGNTYFAYFSDTNFDFNPRLYIVTNTTVTAGNYRLGIAVGGGSTETSVSNILQADLVPGNDYTVVVRVSVTTGDATIWVNPTNETATGLETTGNPIGGISVSDTSGNISVANTAICGFGVRNALHAGPTYISFLTVGTTFADVLPSSDGSNPAFIAAGPQNITDFAGQPVTLSVVAGGDSDTLGYQWSFDGTNIAGATSSTYVISSLETNDAGSYSVLVTNAANPAGASASSVLNVLASDIAPTIVKGPTNLTVTAASTATFSVSATDSGAPVDYQWYQGSSELAGETNSLLAISSVVLAENGKMFHVVVTNPNGTSTTSTNATLTVNPPAPITTTIQYVRSLLDNVNYNTNGLATLYTVTGTNTVWENLTSSGNSEFFIQDGTAGVTVFWSGAISAVHQPPAGAVVTVTAPAGDFDGLLELEPVFTNTFHSVSWTNVGALPAPQPLPFDPDILNNANLMQKHLVGEYFVASNVFIDLSTGPTFGNNANDPLTNGNPGSTIITLGAFNETNATKGTNYTVKATNENGETFVIFYNDHTDIYGATKPAGPVTVYGVLAIFGSTPYTNSSYYEFTPSRLADIVPAVIATNVISNIVRYGDLATNTYNTTVLQPGETLTMTVVAADPGGGTTTISDLGGNGIWSAVSGNGSSQASVSYTYTATAAEAGMSDLPTLTATFSSTGYTGVYSNINTIYVPTADEQTIRISEVFFNTTTDTNSPAYNPLMRNLPDPGVVTVNDQYIEIANVNPLDPVSVNRWTLYSGVHQVYQFINGESLSPGSVGLVYGGPSGTDPDTPNIPGATQFLVDENGNGLLLSTNGGTVSLFNLAGYLIDRVVYPPSLITGSWSRFLNLNGQLLPQAWIATNVVTPGYQYDGGLWSSPTTVPASVPATINYIPGTPVSLGFTALTNAATTLWQANNASDHFLVVTGLQFGATNGAFSITNPPAFSQYYFITTQ